MKELSKADVYVALDSSDSSDNSTNEVSFHGGEVGRALDGLNTNRCQIAELVEVLFSRLEKSVLSDEGPSSEGTDEIAPCYESRLAKNIDYQAVNLEGIISVLKCILSRLEV